MGLEFSEDIFSQICGLPGVNTFCTALPAISARISVASIFAWLCVLYQVAFMPTGTIVIISNWIVLPVKFVPGQRVRKSEDIYSYYDTVT